MVERKYDYMNPIENAYYDDKKNLLATPDHRFWSAVSREVQLSNGKLYITIFDPILGKKLQAELNEEVRIFDGRLWLPLPIISFQEGPVFVPSTGEFIKDGYTWLPATNVDLAEGGGLVD